MVIELLIAGLVAFVSQDPGEATLLLIDTSDWDAANPGAQMPRHYASLGLLEDQLALSCEELPEPLGARLGPQPARDNRAICWIPLAGRALSLGSSGSQASIPGRFLGDLSQIGPTHAASVRPELLQDGAPEFLASRVHVRFRAWEPCTYVSTIEAGIAYAHEWEFRHPLSMSGDGHALRLLASSQVLEIEHSGHEIVVDSLETQTEIGRVGILQDLEEPARIVIKNSTGASHGPFPTSDPHFVAYYELTEGGTDLTVHSRRIPHRVESKREVEECENPYIVRTCAAADRDGSLVDQLDAAFESWSQLPALSREAEIRVFLENQVDHYKARPYNVRGIAPSPFDQPTSAAIGLSVRAASPSCAYGPPLCPQALLREPPADTEE